MSSKKQCVIYADEGVSALSFRQAYRSMQEVFEGYFEVKRICANEVVLGEWKDKTAVFVMPGGRDLGYHQLLSPQGCQQIRSFVFEGGVYLGFCAGAYFGCSAIEFEKGFPYEVCGDRDLCFFSGKAIGTVIHQGTYQDGSEVGALALKVRFGHKSDILSCYYNGGCSFQGDLSGVQVVASYEDVEGSPPAIIRIKCGVGVVLLSGVHIEFSVSRLQKKETVYEPMILELERFEEERKQKLKLIIQETLLCAQELR